IDLIASDRLRPGQMIIGWTHHTGSGIEIDDDHVHIITRDRLQATKPGCLILDAAADAGRAIEGTQYTTIGEPIHHENGRSFYEVNNSPSIFHRETNPISRILSEQIYRPDAVRLYDLIKEIQ
ncbi:MAG: hypothetical protein FJ042_00295, partial [Candidatus Cloacimonetes bacterium]|nr:hypothetical protein [Candidatus Cloacimonadota bacterium]